MKRILVTGASGCIGRHCLPFLVERGDQIHAVSCLTPPPSSPAPSTRMVTWHQVDLLQPANIRPLIEATRPTHLLHLAWYVVPGKSGSAPANFLWLQSSLELLAQFQSLGGERVLMAGSSFEYDWSYGYCTERLTPLKPSTLYGTCKDALRSVLEGLARDTALSVVWPRIFFLYGPHEHPDRLVPSVIRSLLRREPALCSHGNQIRDYLYVEDVAEALVLLLHTDLQGPVNVGSGRPITLRDLVARIGERLDGTDLVRLGALPSRPNDAPLVVADVSRLTEELHWRPRFDLDHGLERSIAWWTHQLSAGPHP